jgi:metallo-beta-lactamase class B
MRRFPSPLTAALVAAACFVLPATAAAPHRMIGNIYFVGQDDLCSYFIPTPKGAILINTGFEFSVPVIHKNIEKLGFKYSDIKIMLVTHAHSDHAAGFATIKKQTGAKMWAIEQEAELLETGGKTDFLFGSNGWFNPVKVDKVFKDGEKIELGGTVITPHLTPGHTKGATSYSIDITEDGKLYHVLIANMPQLNDGVVLVKNPKYPEIAQDYQKAFNTLRQLPCDVFLSSHTTQFHFNRKFHLDTTYNPQRYVDPDGFQFELDHLQDVFYTELKEQMAEEQWTHDKLNFKEPKDEPVQ